MCLPFLLRLSGAHPHRGVVHVYPQPPRSSTHKGPGAAQRERHRDGRSGEDTYTKDIVRVTLADEPGDLLDLTETIEQQSTRCLRPARP